nr:Rpn family recombination-promoting nuclease/putative transposase [Escherichia coli]
MMRYSIAAMHRHLEADHDKLPLVVPMHCFIRARPHLIRSQCAGLIYFYSPELARRVYNSPFPAGGYHHHTG